ncbi:uncharacterized protein LOC143428020 [Xylocopa sonorina]|uniref:uncharacterized protein LOC143428020 n=1 Tax=Xylocopa sonorina TaxID=1818115 RepID=UPI00403AA991
MPHAGLAALLLGVTVATVLYFMFGNNTEQPHSYHRNTHNYSQRQYYIDDPDDCPICLSSLAHGSKCILRNCKHKFHKNCIQEWKTQAQGPQALCPICRSPLT